jgi:hypothetical protein
MPVSSLLLVSSNLFFGQNASIMSSAVEHQTCYMKCAKFGVLTALLFVEDSTLLGCDAWLLSVWLLVFQRIFQCFPLQNQGVLEVLKDDGTVNLRMLGTLCPVKELHILKRLSTSYKRLSHCFV